MAPEGVYKESRTYHVRDRSPSDDEFDDRHYGSRTTVHRYKVNPGSRLERVERIERIEDIDDDRRSRFSGYAGRSERDLLDVDGPRGRSYVPERPRSAFEPSPRNTMVEHKHVTKHDYDGDGVPDDIEIYKESREYDRDRGDRTSRQVVERIEREPGDPLGPEVRSRVEKKVVERGDDQPLSPRERDWDRQSRGGWDRDETDVRVEKRVERREDGEMRIERRMEERRDEPYGEVERYRKETEYYEPAPSMPPIVIRQRAPEQKIIVQEAPSPAPLVIRDERRWREDDEYYRRREVGLYRGRERQEEYAMERYDRRRERDRREYSDDDEEYYVRKKTIVRERSQSADHHRKRHLAEGALAGAGAAALLATRRSGDGGLQENRGRKVIAGAALGALGTEVFKRARSAYQDHYGEDGRGRSRSRSRSRGRDEDRHSKLKTGLGLAAAALAVAGAAKYYQTSKVEKEEASRGRSLRRGYSEEYYSSRSRSRTRSRSRSRAASVAKAAAGTAAVAGIVKHLRDKSRARSGGRSRSRSHSRSKSPRHRSRSRLRTGAEIVAAGLAGGAAKKIYEKHQEKKERERSRSVAAGKRRSRSRSLSSDWSYDDRDRRRRSRSHSRSNARARLPPLPHNDSSRADSELGMVEYGNNPVAPEARRRGAGGGGGGGYDSATEDYDGRRRHRGRRSSYSDSDQDDKKPEKKRSKSRLREMAAAGAGAAAAAIGLKGIQKRREKSKERDEEEERRHEDEMRERDRDRDRDRPRNRSRVGFDDRHMSPERDRNREREERARDRERRRYEDEIDDGYDSYDDRYHGHSHPPSPPHASGGAYIRPAMSGAAGPGFTSHPNIASTNLNDYGGYHPADYGGYPPNSAPTPTGMPPPPAGMPPAAPPYPMDPRPPNNAPGPPPMGFPPGPPPPRMNPHGDHVSQVPLSKDAERPDGVKPRAQSLSRSSSSSFFSDTTIAAPSRANLGSGNEHSKSVVFIPLSPKSSQTLRKLHEGQGGDKDTEHSDLGDDKPTADQQQLVPHPSYPRRKEDDNDPEYVDVRSRSRRHRSSSEGAMVHRPRHRQDRYLDTEDDDLVEVLPDRFDSQGRPIHDDGPRPRRWSSRRGEFEYRSPRRRGLEMQGQWAVGGTDNETVERAARQIVSMLDGKGGWLGVLGGILGATLGRGDDRQGLVGEAARGGDGEGRRDRRRERDRHSRHDDGDELEVGSAAVEYGAGDWREDHHGQRRRRRGYD
ncbi:hypothetical protein MCOR27_011106 [Pyricularia oryzae]|uniref:DUF3824 domain-containing protein n=1 Tax=Pyricularia grisea TaxID=148305 RepID=A0ABQ8NQY3_PYRGI|nr:hypothetical protein MCOR01_000947 [Pyricularia oryzae]KAI6300593.1 hypothetical protein MCOR33_003749 [Pyricularia grisea]KAH9427242.1 hypothetical protein MCOR02_012366 [Pyricularia oryzae]KAI6257269.1 hypothetical protein MCOR19_006331 [Pyricularia oryzae]KAI6266245.1 hypothetical protein MCOR27_011106 [Pyricularia oryzae]